MVYLLDTGVLLRLFDHSDPDCRAIRKSLWELRKSGHRFVVSVQNIAEFWNVSTRPTKARGGYGYSVFQTEQRLRVIERACAVVSDHPNLYSTWRNLVTSHAVMGVQVHDARIVAWMMTQDVTHIITLNVSDFHRYPGINALTPDSLGSPAKK
jgi:predicted nucleic acid-binding protein